MNRKFGFVAVVAAFAVGLVVSFWFPKQWHRQADEIGSRIGRQILPVSQADEAQLPKIAPGDPLPANRFIELSKLVNPAVVNVFTTYLPKPSPFAGGPRVPGDPFFDLFQQFMGPGQMEPQQPAQSLGTGFIIRSDGLILTNNHVVESGDEIRVQLNEHDKKDYEAKVIGKDKRTDIALIKIDAKKKLPTVQLGTSSDVQVGQWVAAFGNPYGHGHTMTKGIISAKGREIDQLNVFPFLQTDTSINPGNSGGPLVDLQGLVIGVNTAIDARAQGIGFAIPIDNVKAIIPELEKNGRVQRGFVGVAMTDIDDDTAKSLGLKRSDGALITQVIKHSPAATAGLKPYDLIIEFDGHTIASTHDLLKAVIETPVGKHVQVKIVRGTQMKVVALTVGDASKQETEPRPRHRSMEHGRSAPYGFGFSIADYSRSLAQQFDLPPLHPRHPIVVEVDAGSPAARAGLAPGDVILDVNRRKATNSRDAIHALKKGANVLRVLKQNRVLLISLKP